MNWNISNVALPSSDLTTSTSCHSEAAGYLDLHGRQYHGYNEHRAYFRPDDKVSLGEQTA